MNVGRWFGLIVAFGFLGGQVLVCVPAFRQAKTIAQRSSCQANLRAIVAACRVYAKDYESFPPVSTANGRGWSELLVPQAAGLRCPAGYNAESETVSDYFMNFRLGGLRADSIQNPLYTVAFGDGPDNGPPNSHLWEAPLAREIAYEGWAARHSVGGNYAFVDGHVKFLQPRWFRDKDRGPIKFDPRSVDDAEPDF